MGRDQWRASLDANPSGFVTVALPPVQLGEYLDLDRSIVTDPVQQIAVIGVVDHAISHHSTVLIDIAGRRQPIRQMKSQQPLGSSSNKSFGKLRIPPAMIDVRDEARPFAEAIA